jgi:hypothetical protein
MSEPVKEMSKTHEQSKEEVKGRRRVLTREKNAEVENPDKEEHSWWKNIKGFAGNDKHVMDSLTEKAKNGASMTGPGSLVGAGMAGFAAASDMLDIAETAGDFLRKKKGPTGLPTGAKAGPVAGREAAKEAVQAARGGRLTSMFKGIPKNLTGKLKSVVPSLKEGGSLALRGRTLLAGAGRLTGGLALTTYAFDVGSKTIEARNSGEENPYARKVDNLAQNNPEMGFGDKARLLAAKQLGALAFAIDRGKAAGVKVFQEDRQERGMEGSKPQEGLMGKLLAGARDYSLKLRAGYESVTTTFGTLNSELTKRSNWTLPKNGTLDRGTGPETPALTGPVQQMAM